ncbi:MAG: tRNA (N(6)-L-threonylcarbamoyladenosine(37)-C(2))-methylthiotransferase MtaB [Sphingobium sp.]
MAGPDILTFGCRLNIAESEAMRHLAADQDDLIIVNSCAVTGEAVRQARQAIRRARRERPDARIVVTGCAAQTDPAMFAAMPEVDRIIGNREKMEAVSFLPVMALEPDRKVRVADIMAVREHSPHLATAFADHARAFVEVQNGCDHRCTFCIIPYGRGNSRSVPAGAVIDRVKALVDEGYREIVLTGVDVTSYGPDLPGAPTLGGLVERILTHVPDLPRLRLSSLDSVEIDDRLFALVTQEPRVMPHLHLSLQAGDDMILKRMKRRHSRAQAVRIVERLLDARPEISIGADIIAGFPTETDDMADNSLALVRDCHIVHGHIFPYSPRSGTPAARMPQVEPAAIKRRAARLREACADNREHWLASLVGTWQNVLAEGDGGHGHAENFAPVRLAHPVSRGEIVPVRIAGVEKGALIAQEAGS